MISRTLSLGLSLLSVAQYVQSQTCYWPNHNEATNYTACNAAATESACCRPWEVCLTNGLCLQTQGLANRISRGSCTDQSFSSPSCPSACNDVATDNSLTIFEAYDDVDTNGAFCCVLPYNQSTGECQVSTKNSAAPFSLDPFQVIVDRSTGNTLPLNGSDATSSTNSSAAETVTVTATSTGDSSSIAPVAAGIAVPLGILLIASLIACGILFSQLRKLRREHNSRSDEGHHGQAHYDMGAASMAHHNDYKSVPQEQPYQSPPTAYAHYASPTQQQPQQHFLAEAPANAEVGEADSQPVNNMSYK